jgi:hypothetical protein
MLSEELESLLEIPVRFLYRITLETFLSGSHKILHGLGDDLPLVMKCYGSPNSTNGQRFSMTFAIRS